MVPQENLGSGKTPKELCDSRVEEPDPREQIWEMEHTSQLQVDTVAKDQIQDYHWEESMDLTILEHPSNPREH